MRIFLSYGHDEYASLALRIKRDVEALGHEVWFDLGYLKVGSDWEQYIADGLDWVAAVPGTARFLLLMTPHSVRRPNGYCLNELARAFGRNLPIIPVMCLPSSRRSPSAAYSGSTCLTASLPSNMKCSTRSGSNNC